MKLTVLGSSPAIPNASGASSGYLIQSAQGLVLVDCGHGVTSILQRAARLSDLTGIIISHMHPDHFFDLIPLTYGFIFDELPPIPLLLPPDGLDVLARLHNAVELPPDFPNKYFEVSEYDPALSVSLSGMSISIVPTQHFIPAYAMRFQQGAKPDSDIFYSSDTARTDAVTDLAHDASLGLVEATLLERKDGGERHGHMTAAEAGALARDAGIRRLVLTHYRAGMAEQLAGAASATFGQPVEMATSGATFHSDQTASV